VPAHRERDIIIWKVITIAGLSCYDEILQALILRHLDYKEYIGLRGAIRRWEISVDWRLFEESF
jgi:hypothetical protein